MPSRKHHWNIFNIDKLSVGKVQSIWDSTGSESVPIRKAGFKCKLLLGVFTTQSMNTDLTSSKVDSTCPLCRNGIEDRWSFLLTCATLETTRRPFITQMRKLVPNTVFWNSDHYHQTILTELILDSSRIWNICWYALVRKHHSWTMSCFTCS